MKKALIFGAGGFGREILEQAKCDYEIIGFLDNNKEKKGTIVDGVEVLGSVDVLSSVEYDVVILGTMVMAIVDQLTNAGVSRAAINTEYIAVRIHARINFMRDYAKILLEKEKDFCVAEGGVYQGEFAKEISYAFPNQDIYLFDTFEGFDDRDINFDKECGYSNSKLNYFSNTSEQEVLSVMPYKEKVHICKGFFPDSASDVCPDNKYGFVNLDFDLYQPILAGLEYFYPKMIKGGIILIHDYYHVNYKAIPEAIKDFESLCGEEIYKFPIGDHCSMAIIKQ